eukprot:m.120078 g.120078  ORF g.120078 m.120078 type:complete len:560 (-) comp23213_c0_seq1:136-1815(-)
MLRLLVFVGLALSVAALEEPAVLVVGKVTQNTARILVDLFSNPIGSNFQVWLFRKDETHGHYAQVSSFFQEMTVSQEPKLVVVPDLEPATFYSVVITEQKPPPTLETGAHPSLSVFFRTRPLDKPDCGALCDTWRMLFVSCDRHADVPEDGFVQEMAARESTTFDVMFHIGDQVYADKLYRNQTVKTANFQTALAAFRQLYRETWSRPAMALMLRQGSHIMTPDDHEIANSVEFGMLQDPLTKEYVLAGRWAMYEYQAQLQRDIPSLSTGWDNPECLQMYSFHQFGSTRLVLLETRFFRSLSEPDTIAPLTGVQQLNEVVEFLQSSKNDPSVEHMVLVSSVPLFTPGPTAQLVADWFEGDKYALHPVNLENTLVILREFFAATQEKKSAILIGGDLHMSDASQLCIDVHGVRNLSKPLKRKCMDYLVTSGLTFGADALSGAHLIAFDAVAWWLLPTQVQDPAGHSDLGSSVIWTYYRSFWYPQLINNYLALTLDGSFPAQQQGIEKHVYQRAKTVKQHFKDFIFSWVLFFLLRGLLFSLYFFFFRLFFRSVRWVWKQLG